MGAEELGPGLLFALLFVFWAVMMALSIGVYVFYVWSIVDIAKTPPELFEWPGEHTKTQWLAGIAIAVIIPFGMYVTPFMWWTQVRTPRRQGRLATRPFWAPTIAPPIGARPFPSGWPPIPPPPA
jgi:hypothetical protein